MNNDVQHVTFLDIEQSKQQAIKGEVLRLEGERDIGHKGKIVEKVVYEKNKHIFPYKNWKYVSGYNWIYSIV